MRGLMMLTAAAAAVALAACSEEAPQQNQAQAKAALTPGLYEASWSVTEIRSTDKTDPATKLTVGETGKAEACIQEGPVLDLELFAEGDDECKESNSYVRGGRINIQMQCKRPDELGPVMQTVTGTSTADGFQGEISTSTYLTGFGDYSMRRSVTGKRIGDCPAEDSPAANAS
jgi:hypothetical protein